MKILLIGTGGYAANYIRLLLEQKDSELVWEGIVDPYYGACQYKEQIDRLGIPVYASPEEFYAGHEADLTVISTPAYLHCNQSIFALSNGSSVLCEKPAAPTVAEAEAMARAEKETGRFLAIGYQWSYSEAVRALKKDLLKGELGAPRSFKTAISWPRNKAYYNRGGGWAGRIQRDGRLILDSIAANACAHYLHNMLFLLGNQPESAAFVSELEAECYRANEIENFDTCSIRMKTAAGTELYFAASHATDERKNPIFFYRFENATVTYSQDDGSQIEAIFSDGRRKQYGDPFASPFQKFWDCVKAVKEGTRPICTVKTALPHVHLIEDLYRQTPINTFCKERIRTDAERDAVFVEGLTEKLYEAYGKEALFSEIDPEFFKA